MKVMAVASGGGHWKQLMLLRKAFVDAETVYVTTIKGLAEQNNILNFEIVPDANKNKPILLVLLLFRTIFLICKYRPEVVVTTGAAPGLLILVLGRLIGAKTLWIDSIANGDEISLAGRLAKKTSTLTLSQWDDVAIKSRVEFKGGVL